MSNALAELKAWLSEQAEQLKTQHDQGADQQLILQGRYEAATIVLSKIEQLTQEAAPEAEPKRKSSKKKGETSAS